MLESDSSAGIGDCTTMAQPLSIAPTSSFNLFTIRSRIFAASASVSVRSGA